MQIRGLWHWGRSATPPAAPKRKDKSSTPVPHVIQFQALSVPVSLQSHPVSTSFLAPQPQPGPGPAAFSQDPQGQTAFLKCNLIPSTPHTPTS